METSCRDNEVLLIGTSAGEPVYSHSARSENFYTLPFTVRRLSLSADTVNLTLRESMLGRIEPGGRLAVRGELRSFNSRRAEWPRLVITVFVRELERAEEEDENRVFLRGTLCKPPNLRRTPMGRDICDLILAVNRPYARSDYLPCICWGRLARESTRWAVGDKLALEGRIQSRLYRKLSEDGLEVRTAFEVSVSRAEKL